MLNLRYHIASLVAVFLALAIGLVLGGLVVRGGAFDQQQKALVSSLQSEFSALKKANSSLSGQLALETAMGRQLTDAWTAGRLSGRTVAVITSGSSSEGVDEVVSTVKAAGGTVAVITLVKPGFGLADSQVASSVASLMASGSANASATPVAPTASAVASALAGEWATGSSRALTSELVAAGVIKVSGLAHSAVATLAVDLATANKEPDSAGLDLASAYAAQGHYALGAEPLDGGAGVAAAAAARKLSALDTLGTNAGRFTLVALFSGGDQGYYSTSARGATQFPPMPAARPAP